MTMPAFLAWVEFYKLQPFDDYSLMHRPAALIASLVGGNTYADLLGFLDRDAVPEAKSSIADIATMRAFGMKRPPPKE